MRELHYKPPQGMVDIPYVWVFDGRSLTNGTSPSGNRINITDADFYLRSIVGVPTVAPRMLYYNASESQAQGLGVEHGAGTSILFPFFSNRWTVVPEKYYPVQSMIRFDLQAVAKALNTSDNEISFIGFQGVKRVAKGQWDWGTYKSDYVYYEHPYSYEILVTMDFFADQGAAPRKFSIPVTEYDFELQKIAVHDAASLVRDDNPEDPEDPELPQSIGPDPFLILLYDPTGYRALTSQPCPIRWLHYFENTGNFQSVFPVPTYVYPFGANIEFDLTSLVNAAGGTRTFQFSFQGIRRVPC